MVEWLKKDSGGLRVGMLYDADAESSTVVAIEQYYRATGRRIGLSRNLHLDYSSKTARVVFNVFEATPGPNETVFPPFGPDCESRIAIFNLTDLDDHVPIPLLDRIMSTKAFGCYDEKSINQDNQKLQSVPAFTHASISAPGDVSKSVYVRVRSRPLTIRELRIETYGPTTAQDLEFAKGVVLPSRIGQKYSSSLAYRSQRILQREFQRPDRRLKVFEDVDLISETEVRVSFHVLVYPLDKTFLNGKELIPLE